MFIAQMAQDMNFKLIAGLYISHVMLLKIKRPSEVEKGRASERERDR